MAKRLLAAPLLCIAAAVPAQAQAPEAAGEPVAATRAELVRKLDENFAQVDSNRDGSIDRSEIEAVEIKAAEELQASVNQKLAEQFARLDTDRSGQISLAEFQAGATVRASRKPEEALQRIDGNKDGKVSREEYRARRLRLFDSLDANKDGILTPDEQRSATAR